MSDLRSPKKSGSSVYVMLTTGFVLGLIFGAFVFRAKSTKSPSGDKAERGSTTAAVSERKVDPTSLAEVENLFLLWGGYAVWENNVTEIAMEDPETKTVLGYYEVRRYQGVFYYRMIPRLTRPLIDHGVTADIPFGFTEPQWLQDLFHKENPDYEQKLELVQLPPRPPERVARVPKLPSGAPSPSTSSPPMLTPGAGRN